MVCSEQHRRFAAPRTLPISTYACDVSTCAGVNTGSATTTASQTHGFNRTSNPAPWRRQLL
jgi:hypothetical protein